MRILGSQLVVIDWCCMCKRVGETVNHLLLHCPIVKELRSMVHGVYTFWDISKDVVELLAN